MNFQQLYNVLLPVAAVALTLGVVIIFHEFGHFLVCKLSGVKVLAFSFGFGKELFGFEHKGTRYSIRLIPLGGYVKPLGEELDESKGEPGEFFSAPWYTRIGIVYAGAFMNYVLAFLIFCLVFFVWGKPELSEKAVIGEVVSGLPADKAGLIKDDIITAINSQKVELWKEAASTIHKQAGKEIEFEILRGSEILNLKITPQLDEKNNVGIIGIMPLTVFKNMGFTGSIKEGAYQVYFWTYFSIKYLIEKIVKLEKPDIAGPVGIIQIVSKAAKTGAKDLFFLIALISISIGWFNLLPIAPLDGGHAALYLYEGISRKKLNKKIVGYANMAGLAFVLFIVIFATYNDILRWRSGFWK